MRSTPAEKLLAELVALPSVNPATASPEAAGEKRSRYGEKNLAEFIASTAAHAELEVELQTVLPGRPNVIARLLPRHAIRRTLLLAPHLDTVNAADSQFTPRRRNGRLYGRGACDTKGSIAAMLSALFELAQSPSRPPETEIIFTGLVDEEYAQAGSRALILQPDFRRLARQAKAGHCEVLAIVGEPTRTQVVTAHKGSLWLTFETRGRAAHGSAPQLGRNAVHEMARVVDWIETDYAARLRRRKHPLLGSGTVSVGMISGGTQPNIVPDRCSMTIDRRTLPGETETGVCREIAAALRAKGLSPLISGNKPAPCPPMETRSDLPLVRQFLHHAGQRHPAGVVFFSDAAVFSGGGIPSVLFGPGDIAQGHTADEWIALDSLERGRALLLRFLKSLS